MNTNNTNSINWAEKWDQQVSLSLLKWEDADFWNAKTQLPSIGVKSSNYADQLLLKMNLSSEVSVLDVGCGTGTVSIPLAKIVRHVTALDSDPGLLPVLTHRCMSEGINNLRFVNENWRQAVNIDQHDIVLASRFRQMKPLKGFVEQMHRATKKLCYITWIADRKEIDSQICEILNIDYHPLPKYDLVSNLLSSIEIDATVEFFESSDTHRFENENDAIEEATREYKIESSEARDKITPLVASELKQKDGFWWRDTTTKWALIWWHK
ncbi:methyltransferase domain-containing protein [Chloroflexota bacterium]